MKPLPTGSATYAKTMGTVRVAAALRPLLDYWQLPPHLVITVQAPPRRVVCGRNRRPTDSQCECCDPQSSPVAGVLLGMPRPRAALLYQFPVLASEHRFSSRDRSAAHEPRAATPSPRLRQPQWAPVASFGPHRSSSS